MRLIGGIILAVLGNLLGLLAAARWVQGFGLTGDTRDLAIAALILTVMNLVLRPVLKLFLGPLIVLTLGLAAILVNVLILLLLDFLLPGISIQGIEPLFVATILISVINFLVHILAGI